MRVWRRRRQILGLFTIGLFSLIIAACGGGEEELTVQLSQQEGSGQSGRAVLTSIGNRTEVVIEVSPGATENDPQPVHIHFGTCGANLGQVQATLSDVLGGRPSTIVEVPLGELREGDSAINLHLSYPGIRTYTACGNIPD